MPNWCHNTLTVSGEADELARFVEAARPRGENGEDAEQGQPLSFASFVPQPSDEELRKLENYQPCTMCGATGTLPENEMEAHDLGAKWYPWMDPAEREERTCNVCRGTTQERVGMEGWYEWRLRNWGTKWDAAFANTSGVMALGNGDMDVEASKESQVATITPTVAVYKFDTAWSPPAPVIEVASEQHPELEFVLQFAEVGHEYAGRIRFVAGVTVEEEELEVEDVLAPEEMWF